MWRSAPILPSFPQASSSQLNTLFGEAFRVLSMMHPKDRAAEFRRSEPMRSCSSSGQLRDTLSAARVSSSQACQALSRRHAGVVRLESVRFVMAARIAQIFIGVVTEKTRGIVRKTQQ